MKKLLKKRYIIPFILIMGIVLGPRLKFPAFDTKMPSYDFSLENVEDYINKKEATFPNLKPDNEARIVWADSTKSKTEFSVVYLHGYSASPMEGNGIHFEFAKRYGANLYLARLADHGLKKENAFLDVTSKDWVESAKEAIAIGNTIGDKCIVLSASTGSTLSNYLAADNPDLIHGQIMYSPNFALADNSSKMLLMPWGLHLARLVMGGKTRTGAFAKGDDIHWTTTQRLEGVGALVHLVKNATTDETFKKIKSPYLVAYYYKNEEERDKTVSIPAMKKFHSLTNTPAEQKQLIAMPTVGDHCFVSTRRSKDLESVKKVSFDFAEGVLGMKVKE